MSGLNPEFKIDAFVMETNFTDLVPLFRLITKESRASLEIQRLLLVQTLCDSMMDDFWNLLQEEKRPRRDPGVLHNHVQGGSDVEVESRLRNIGLSRCCIPRAMDEAYETI